MTYTGVNSEAQDQATKIGNPQICNTPAPASYAAGNQTYTTSDILGGVIVHDGTGGDTGTLPTAALLVAAIPNCRVGDTVYCLIVNGANAAGTLTIAAGTGGTFDAHQGGGSQIIAFASSKWVIVRITATAIGSQAYVIYS